MIPKIIHRVWLSELPDKDSLAGRCMASQDKLQDYGYEIRTYNINNFDFSISKYLLQAYSLKKYAFISDYIRFFVLYHFGGIYLDCDAEVYKPFDSLLNAKYFLGFSQSNKKEIYGDWGVVELAAFGSEAKTFFLKKCLDYYNTHNFIEDNYLIHCRFSPEDIVTSKFGSIVYENGKICPKSLTNIDEYIKITHTDENTIYYLENEWQGIRDQPHEYYIKNNTIVTHHSMFSWQDQLKNSEYYYFDKYSKKDQQNYFNTYNSTKKSKLPNNIQIYIITKKNNKNVKEYFELNKNTIILNNLNNVDTSNNVLIINYDLITDIQLFKYFLKNINKNENNYLDINYNIKKYNDISKYIIKSSLFIYHI